MFSYFARRLAVAMPVLIAAVLVSFFLIRLVPGDPAVALLGNEADDAAIAALRHQLALDRPLAIQFYAWISEAFLGNLGRSTQSRQLVLPMLLGALGPTAILAASAMIIAVLIGVPCGVSAASDRNSVRSTIFSTLALFGLSMPSFWLGILLILLLSIHIPIFPASGYVSPFTSLIRHLAHLALPALTLGMAMSATTMRITQTAMLQVLREPFMRTALAKGLPLRKVIWTHGFANARPTIIVQLAVQAGKLLGGVVVIETIFSWPGIGKLMVDAVFARDYPVIQGAVLLSSVIFVLLNLIADLCQVLIDPRVRAQ